jgi:hypothetical protein
LLFQYRGQNWKVIVNRTGSDLKGEVVAYYRCHVAIRMEDRKATRHLRTVN